jgi:hypothetical protein
MDIREQEQVVERIDRMRRSTYGIRGAQTSTTAELGALLPSILDKAFKGEL